MTLGAVTAVQHHETGIASALLNTAQQIGGAFGLAILSTISTFAANDQLPKAASALYQGLAAKDSSLITKASDALTHGYSMAFTAAGAMFLAALAVTTTAVNARKQQHSQNPPTIHLG